MENNEAKKLVIKAGKVLSKTGLIARTWGNVSARIDEKTFCITASGRNYVTLTSEEIVQVKIKDLSWSGNFIPSSEKMVHRKIYELRPEVNFIIHTHQNYASAVSVSGLKLISADEKYDKLCGKVLISDYGLPGTETLCEKTGSAVKSSLGKAVIMKHHGAVCFGENYEDAFGAAMQLEELCKAYTKTLNISQIENPSKAIIHQYTEKNERLYFWNIERCVVDYAKTGQSLAPFLDDFAQLVGAKVSIVETEEKAMKIAETHNAVILLGKGILCAGDSIGDLEAINMIVSKNVFAYFVAKAHGNANPISENEAQIMRNIYLEKYSKLAK